MGVALFTEFEEELPGIDAASVDGKALARAEPVLREIAARIGVTPLMEFYGADDAALAEELFGDEGFEVGEMGLPPARWFEAGEGLRTVSGLLRHLEARADALADAGPVIADLRGMERVLTEAWKAGVRWHLAVDF